MVAIRITDDGAEIDPQPLPTTTEEIRKVAAESRGLCIGHRVLIAATMPTLGVGGNQGRRPVQRQKQLPTGKELAAIFELSMSALTRGGVLLKHATPTLLDSVRAGKVTAYLAARLATELPDAEQDRFATRVAAGANVRETIRQFGLSETREDRGDTRPRAPLRPVRANYLTVDIIDGIRYPLAALEQATRGTDGLDPRITDEQAAQLLDGLSKGRAALQRVVKALTQRKESTQP